MPSTCRAALGFSVHTGWAAAVALTASDGTPRVIDRRRIELVDPAGGDPARFVFHTASKLDLPAAQRLIDQTTKEVRAATLSALRSVLAAMKKLGCEAACAGIIVGGSRPLGALETILRSHAAIHTAEGELYRGAVAAACDKLGLAVCWFNSGKLPGEAAARLGIKVAALEKQVAGMKQLVGSPWGQDQRLAMTAAWAALGTA